MKHHPDRNPDDKGSEEKREAKEAMELTDAKKARGVRSPGHAGVDPRRVRPQGGARGPDGSADSPTRSATSRRDLRRAARRSRQWVIAAWTFATTSSLVFEEAARGTEAKIRIPTMENADLQGHGREARHAAEAVRRSPRARRGAGLQGFFSIQQTCLTCRGTARFLDPCATSRRGSHQEAQDAVGEDSGGVDQMIASVDRRRRGRNERRAVGRPLRRRQPQAALGVPARGGRPALRDADQLRRRRARRRNRDSDARRPREDQDSVRDADGPGVPASEQGHSAGPGLGDGRSLLLRRRGDAGQAHAAAERPPARIRGHQRKDPRRTTRQVVHGQDDFFGP